MRKPQAPQARLVAVARSRLWTPLGLALLCSHCAITGILALVAGAGLLSAPVLFGVDLNWVWPPFFILGAFGLWLWSGREKNCPVE